MLPKLLETNDNVVDRVGKNVCPATNTPTCSKYRKITLKLLTLWLPRSLRLFCYVFVNCALTLLKRIYANDDVNFASSSTRARFNTSES